MEMSTSLQSRRYRRFCLLATLLTSPGKSGTKKADYIKRLQDAIQKHGSPSVSAAAASQAAELDESDEDEPSGHEREILHFDED